MAAAFARRYGTASVTVYSAGSDPSDQLNPAVLAAMSEVAIDLTNETPRKLTDAMVLEADVVVTMGCGDACPIYPNKRYVDWVLADPAGQSLDFVRPIRDEIQRRVDELIDELLDQSNRR